MTKKITPRDWEAVSAYIDGELPPKDQARLEARFADEPELRSLMQDLTRDKALFRSLEPMRAPRNFTLTPEMAGEKPRRTFVAPAFQWASAIATVLLIFVFAGDYLGFLRPQQLPLTATDLRETSLSAAAPEETALPLAAEIAPAEEAEGTAELPAAGLESMQVAGTPEATEAAGEMQTVLPFVGAQAENSAADAAEEPAPEVKSPSEVESEALAVEASGRAEPRTLQFWIVEAVLATIAVVSALAALSLRRRAS